MLVSASLRARPHRVSFTILLIVLLSAAALVCKASTIRGVVTDPSGAKVTGANVTLLSDGKVVSAAVSTADGS